MASFAPGHPTGNTVFHIRALSGIFETTSRDATAVYRLRVRRGFEYRGCQGLTFEVDGEWARRWGGRCRVVLEVPGGAAPVECAVVGPDDSGAFWAHVPVRRLDKADWEAVAAEAGLKMREQVEVSVLPSRRPVSLWYPGAEP